MLKTKNATYKAILIFNLLCIVAALVLCALSIVDATSNLAQQIACLFQIAALIYAAYYVFAGFTKDAAKYYKTFAAIFALAQIASLSSLSANANSYFGSLLSALTLGLILVLFLSKNLGKKTSLILCGILVVVVVLSLIAALVEGGFTTGAVIFPIIARFVLAALLGIMTFAKYIDKAARGSK